MPLTSRNQLPFDYFGMWQRVHGFSAHPNSTALTGLGITLTATGTATAYAPATTSRLTMNPVVEALVTTASTSAVSGFRINALFLLRGNVGGAGGFYLKMRWRPATGQTVATHRGFAGVRGSAAAPTDVNPSSLTNIIGMGWDSGDTNIQMMHNDGSGTATRIDLGSDFPRPTADRSNLYDIELFAPRGISEVRYKITNVLTGAEASGTLTTDLPASTVLLTPLIYNSVGGTSSVIGTAIGSLFLVTNL